MFPLPRRIFVCCGLAELFYYELYVSFLFLGHIFIKCGARGELSAPPRTFRLTSGRLVELASENGYSFVDVDGFDVEISVTFYVGNHP